MCIMFNAYCIKKRKKFLELMNFFLNEKNIVFETKFFLNKIQNKILVALKFL